MCYLSIIAQIVYSYYCGMIVLQRLVNDMAGLFGCDKSLSAH